MKRSKAAKNNAETSVSTKIFSLLILALCFLCFSMLVFANNFSDNDCKDVFIDSSEHLKNIIRSDEVEQCLAERWNIDQIDNNGRTALQRAVIDGRNEDVKILLENGASVESKDNYKMTALMYAYITGNYEIAKMLLEEGENPYEIYLVSYLMHSDSSFSIANSPLYPYSLEYMENLLNKYKSKKVRYEMIDGSVDETKLAWIVDRHLGDFETTFGRVIEFILRLFERTSYGKEKMIAISGIEIKTKQEYFPATVEYGSLIKHVAIKFYNGSIYDYSDDNRVLEGKHRGLESNSYYDYANRDHGGYEIGFDAKLMNKAIEITREEWDEKGERWDRRYYDFENHNCQHYLYDNVIGVYLGLGGILYVR